MDMLFDPYADGPFQAASKAAAGTKSRRRQAGTGGPRWDSARPAPAPGTTAPGTAAAGTADSPRSGGLTAGWDRPQLPNAGELLEGLNPQQEEAVKHAGSALLIVAGAGSGKTRVLSNRIAYLIATRRAHHGEILAITFTNKAAAEMRERIEALVGGRAKTMWISTFHSSCVRILRREAKNVGLNSNFSIYDSADSLRLITLVAKNLDLDPKRFAPKAIQHKISALKNELIDADSYASSANYNDPFEQAVAEVFKGYTQRLRQANAMDFDDLIAETVYMFRAFPALADSYRRRFRHVLVDEYQDTNHAQYALVREIVGEGPDAAELTVVGDSDQSIYAFRGADIRNIVEFEKDYPDARTIKLEQNYRSTQTILSAANSVISRNPNRPEKRLWTAEGDGEKIVGYVGENEHDEAQFIAKEIDRLQDEGNLRPGDVAIFYRTNAQSRSIEDVLVRVGLPYKVVGGTRFYERKEIKDALAYLRVLVNPDDDVNLRRILNEPKRGIGDRAEGAVAALAERERTSFMAAARRAEEAPGMATRSVNAVLGFVKLLDDLAEVASGSGAAAALEAVLEQTGYLAALRSSTDPQDESRVENLAELVAVVREYERDNPEGSLGAFLEQVSLVADADQIPDAPAGADIGGRRRRSQAAGRRHPDDPAHRQGPGIPGGVPDRHGARAVPAPALRHRSQGTGRGTPAGLRGPDPGPEAPLPDPVRGPQHVGPEPVQPRQPVHRGDPGRARRVEARRRQPPVRRLGERRRRSAPAATADRSGAPAPPAAPRPALRRLQRRCPRRGRQEPGPAAEGNRRRQRGGQGQPHQLRQRHRPGGGGRRGQDGRQGEVRRRREAAAAALRAADQAGRLAGRRVRPSGGHIGEPGADPGAGPRRHATLPVPNIPRHYGSASPRSPGLPR